MSWIRNVFGWVSVGGYAPTIPNPPPPPAPREVELSCFIKGLIRSMRETPGEWKRTDLSIMRVAWIHESSRTWVTHQAFGDSRYQGPLFISTQECKDRSNAECDALIDALYLYLEDPESVRLDAMVVKLNREREERNTKRRAPFEILGCPPPSAQSIPNQSPNASS